MTRRPLPAAGRDNDHTAAVYGCAVVHPAELASRCEPVLPCRRADPDAWFPEGRGLRGDDQYAARLCVGCPVLAGCLAYALATRQPYGVWGGVSEATREQLLRRRGVAPAAAGHDRPAVAAAS